MRRVKNMIPPVRDRGRRKKQKNYKIQDIMVIESNGTGFNNKQYD
jgi:hypothetical protein